METDNGTEALDSGTEYLLYGSAISSWELKNTFLNNGLTLKRVRIHKGTTPDSDYTEYTAEELDMM